MYGVFTLVVFITSIVFATIGLFAGKLLEDIFTRYDQTKGKGVIYVESMLQIGTIAVLTYAFRVLVGFLTIKVLKTDKFNQADKFAVLVAAPTIFLLQTSLKDKLSFVFT